MVRKALNNRVSKEGSVKEVYEMYKKLITVPLLISASVYVWHGLTLEALIKKLDLLFRWISIENPHALFILASVFITFALLFWRSRGNRIVELYEN